MNGHVTLVAAGSRGDVQPLVAVGRGLRRAGLRVRVVALDAYRPLVVAHGLEHAPLTGMDPRKLLAGGGADWVRTGRNLVAFLRHYRRLVDRLYLDLFTRVWDATADTDLVGFGTLTIMAYPIADRRGIPRVALPLQPITRSRGYPSITVPGPWGRLGGVFNLATHVLGEQLYWATVRSAVNRALVEVLDVAPFPRRGPFRRIGADDRYPFLYGISSTVFPRPTDWPPWHHLTGFWFLDVDEPLPADVESFLAADPPPVYVGFGSMVHDDPEWTAAQVVDAVGRLGRRAIVVGNGLRVRGNPQGVLVVDDVDHARLFPRVAAVVHHGGAGTTAAALRAGVPQVVVPHFADQPFWAERVHRLGVAPRPIRVRRLDADRLEAALREALSPPLRERAAMLSRRVTAEDGVGAAVALILRRLDGDGRPGPVRRPRPPTPGGPRR